MPDLSRTAHEGSWSETARIYRRQRWRRRIGNVLLVLFLGFATLVGVFAIVLGIYR